MTTGSLLATLGHCFSSVDSAKAFSGRYDRDSVYDQMDLPRLHGRGELLDALMADVARGCTLFGCAVLRSAEFLLCYAAD